MKRRCTSTCICNLLIKEQRFIYITILRLDSCATLPQLKISTSKVFVFSFSRSYFRKCWLFLSSCLSSFSGFHACQQWTEHAKRSSLSRPHRHVVLPQHSGCEQPLLYPSNASILRQPYGLPLCPFLLQIRYK